MSTPAAVLIPIFPRPEGEQILLLKRPERPEDPYSGQVCLPGGRLEPADEGTMWRCALRETREEIGLRAEQLAVFAELEWHATGLGHAVKPFVARAHGDACVVPSEDEVAAILWLPANRLEPSLFATRRARDASGREHEVLSFDQDGHEVWGLTARILCSYASGRWSPWPEQGSESVPSAPLVR